MNKPNDSSAVDAANRFRDALNKQRMDEINNRNRAISIAEYKNRIEAENSRKQEEEKGRQRGEQSRKAMENLKWTPKKINR